PLARGAVDPFDARDELARGDLFVEPLACRGLEPFERAQAENFSTLGIAEGDPPMRLADREGADRLDAHVAQAFGRLKDEPAPGVVAEANALAVGEPSGRLVVVVHASFRVQGAVPAASSSWALWSRA